MEIDSDNWRGFCYLLTQVLINCQGSLTSLFELRLIVHSTVTSSRHRIVWTHCQKQYRPQ